MTGEHSYYQMADFKSIIEEEINQKPIEISEFEDGIQHNTFRVRYEEHNDVVFQFAVSSGRELKLLRKNFFWYNRLQDSGLPIPIVRSDGVRCLDNTWYIVTDYLDGENAERDVTPERTRNAGRHLAMLHNSYGLCEDSKLLEVHNSRASLVENNYKNWIRDTFSQSVERFRNNNLEIADKLSDIKYSIGDSIPDDFDNVLCHNDYSPDNLLFIDDQVTGIIDFDLAYIGDRHRDIVDSANSFWMHSPNSDWNPRDKFYQGYNDVKELKENFWEREKLYRFETQVVTVSYLSDLDILTPRQEEFYSRSIMNDLRRFNKDETESPPQGEYETSDK